MTTPHPFHARARAWLLTVLAIAGAALVFANGASAASSAATAPTVACWKRLLNDWYDGRIDRAYPLRCYREAIANLPEDVKVYADAEADIRRAMLAAVRQSRKETGKTPSEATPVKPPSTPKPPSKTPPKSDGTSVPATQVDPGNPGNTGDPTVGPDTLATGATRSADSLPLPLLVLGALALLLLAAAGAGVVNKRLQARRIEAGPPPTEEPPPVV